MEIAEYIILLQQACDLITRDHSYVNILVDSGEISEEEAQNHPQKNFIVKALGTEPTIEPDFYELTIERIFLFTHLFRRLKQ